MKKRFYMPLALAAIAVMAGGCTASDPDNPKDISEAITDGGDDDGNGNGSTTKNPLEDVILTGYSSNGSCSFNYDAFEQLVEANLDFYRSDRPNKVVNVKFGYGTGMSLPIAMTWEYNDYLMNQTVEYRHVFSSLDEITFDADKCFVSAKYATEYVDYDYSGNGLNKPEAVRTYADVKCEYDSDKHLVKITVGDKSYEQKWENGDLIEINSPYYGKSTIMYGEIVNRYGQWDPTLPFMGFLQAFGWFGKAPEHFPVGINTCFNPALAESGETPSNYGLDYCLDYRGVITQSKWIFGVGNEMYVDYQYITK